MAPTKATEALPGSDRVSLQKLELRVTTGRDEGKRYIAKRKRIGIGTHPSNDFVLTDPTLSRFHCEIVLEADGAIVRDVGSRNGTHLQGVRVEIAHLRDGQTLALGKTEIQVETGEGTTDLPLYSQEQFGLLVGRSSTMRACFAMLERAAASDATVLLHGDTGTGKDLAAESIHQESSRRAGPLVVIDCGAMPANLFESELFGHERGAFTGADESREGAFETANGGTLFFDEIGELPAEIQPKLLRALEKRELQRIGSSRRVPVDVRVIAATSRNLRQEVNRRRFRPDLYYRLAVLEIAMPPLRERLSDLPLLIEELLRRMGVDPESAIAAETRSTDFIGKLAQHDWPGNVRELRNHIERCVALEHGIRPDPSRVGSAERVEIDLQRPFHHVRAEWLRHLERGYLEGLLRIHGGNATAAMRAAGISRVQFYRMLARCGLRPTDC